MIGQARMGQADAQIGKSAQDSNLSTVAFGTSTFGKSSVLTIREGTNTFPSVIAVR